MPGLPNNSTTMKPSPFKHQLKSLKHAESTPVVFDCSDPGCVSADTEFLTPTGWKRIDQYVEGDQVAQFYPDSREIEFVHPLAYVKKPCDVMVHIAPARGMSQRLSPEHRVLYYTPEGTHGVCSAAEFVDEVYTKNPSHVHKKFCSTFSVRTNSKLPLTDEQIRIMVAVIADGHFSSKTTRCVIRLKKDRKVERLRKLLAQAAIPYTPRVCGGDPEFLVFTFDAPLRHKEFSKYWWAASQAQLEVIADELPYWDAAQDKRPSSGTRFSTFSEASAEFAQFAFAAAKRPASMSESVRNRTDEGRGFMVEYYVHAQKEDKLFGPGRKESIYYAPNPEGFKYCFEVPTSFLLLRHNGYIFATGNTGKTAVAIWIDQRLRTKRKIKKTLVIAPKSLLRSVWYNDFKKFAPTTRVVVSTAGKHATVFAQDADVYVTNTDAIKWLAQQPKAFFKDFDLLINDESTSFKHSTSQRSKAMAKVSKHFKYRRLMTGTPNSNSITDVWHQAYILDGGQRLGTSFYAFRNTVCIPIQRGRNANAIEWVDKDGAEEAVFGLLSDIVIRHKFEDCVDIPENHRYNITYQMTPKQRLKYTEMQEWAVMELNKLETVTAINAASVTTKLLQIASGAVYSSPDKYHVVDTSRYEMVLDLVEARKHSLVFFLWKHQRDLLVAEAEKRGISFAVLDGSTRESEREAIVNQYQAGVFRTIFAHPKSAGHGLTLTRGTATIWASPTYDLEIFEQGSKRQHRMGQTQKTETIVVCAEDSIDERAFDALMSKKVRMDNLLDLFSTV